MYNTILFSSKCSNYLLYVSVITIVDNILNKPIKKNENIYKDIYLKFSIINEQVFTINKC